MMATASMEITSSEQSLCEERLLLRELTHRINNELASAIAVISLTAARSASAEVKAALAGVQNLLQNYARVHQALQMPEHGTRIDASAYLRHLCQAISRSKLDGRRIELVLVERPLQLNSEQCRRLGMIVSELITNAARHAFGESGGRIGVEVLLSGSFVQCRVVDNGTGSASIRPGRGLTIVDALAKALDGRIDQHFGPQGATSILTFPASA